MKLVILLFLTPVLANTSCENLPRNICGDSPDCDAPDGSPITDESTEIDVADVFSCDQLEKPTGCPCRDWSECQSEICWLKEMRCIAPCDATRVCGQDEHCRDVHWSPAPEPVLGCIPIWTELCIPCQEDRQCLGGTQGRCLSIAGVYRCAVVCNQAVCPGGYRCEDHVDSGVPLCLPENGACP